MSEKFIKVKDRKGAPIRGLWQRNGLFYGQLNAGGKQTKIPLNCEHASQSSDKVLEFRKSIKTGKFKSKKLIAPTLKDYREHDLANTHKAPKTMQGEDYFLQDWISYLPDGCDGRQELSPGALERCRKPDQGKCSAQPLGK